MDKQKLTAETEAILFASPLPVELGRLATVLGIEADQAEGILLDIAETCEKPDRGVRLIRKDDRFRFITKKEFAQTTAAYITSRKSHLSNAAIETLAIAAYRQPVTKTYISKVRGVASAEIVDALEEKGLLAEAGRLDLPGRPMSYVTTDKFLTVFDLNSLDDLPEAEFASDDMDADIASVQTTLEQAQTEQS